MYAATEKLYVNEGIRDPMVTLNTVEGTLNIVVSPMSKATTLSLYSLTMPLWYSIGGGAHSIYIVVGSIWELLVIRGATDGAGVN